MGCTMCDKAENEGHKYYYRWGGANVVIIGCQAHIKEMFAVLNNYQSNHGDIDMKELKV